MKTNKKEKKGSIFFIIATPTISNIRNSMCLSFAIRSFDELNTCAAKAATAATEEARRRTEREHLKWTECVFMMY